ncbi:MAG: BadF/BadG/BcrA/BcrD ATPase family protein, partial [Anaerolineales bacterium]
MQELNSTQGYLLGLDVGSSKTHALITDLQGYALGFGHAGCGNYEVVGEDGLINALNEATQQALVSADVEKEDILGMGLGISGFDWPSETA